MSVLNFSVTLQVDFYCTLLEYLDPQMKCSFEMLLLKSGNIEGYINSHFFSLPPLLPPFCYNMYVYNVIQNARYKMMIVGPRANLYCFHVVAAAATSFD